MAQPFDSQQDLNSRMLGALKESTAFPGEAAMGITNPDGTPLSVTLSGSDIEIGAVEIKNGTTDDRASVDASGRLLSRITDTAGSSVINGQQLMAASLPVVIASNQTAIPVSLSGSAVSLTPASGQVNVAAGPTQAPLAGVATQVDSVHVIANLTNLSNIFLGPTGVTSANGLILEPGRGVTLESVNLATVFINGTAGEGVSFFSLT